MMIELSFFDLIEVGYLLLSISLLFSSSLFVWESILCEHSLPPFPPPHFSQTFSPREEGEEEQQYCRGRELQAKQKQSKAGSDQTIDRSAAE